MKICTWDEHPEHLQLKVMLQLHKAGITDPKWVIYGSSLGAAFHFIDTSNDWNEWLKEHDILAYVCVSTFTIVFTNDDDLILFRLTWM